MNPIYFLIGIHNHQPVGNFPHVFQWAYEQCYRPFLDVLEKHKGIRLSIHHSGPLLDWLEQHQPEYLNRISALVEAGRLEIIGGGYYEPLMPVIPEVDAVGQIRTMSRYAEGRFGQTPGGLWLTERVWEPHLASVLHRSGVRYTVVDDSHFIQAGLNQAELFGYYVTEDQGLPLAVFPIDKQLRYLIPFEQPKNAIDYLKSVASLCPGAGITFADDGEKFGVWPGTHEWVYGEGYLEKLFALIEKNSDWIRLLTFSEYLEQFPSRGRIYLPTCSYEEMGEWTLPPQTQREYDAFVEKLRSSGTYEEYRPFVRGGYWRNFLSKYSESNWMHKRMLRVSALVSNAKPGRATDAARIDLWKGQCNCAYWHGLFGGLYLNYLRSAVYTHLIRAERGLAADRFRSSRPVLVEQCDLDGDLQDEVILTSRDLGVYLSPGRGGCVREIDSFPKAFNLTDSLTRRSEGYHSKIRNAVTSDPDREDAAKPQSIHDRICTKETDLDRFLLYDRCDRASFMDMVFREDVSLEHVLEGKEVSRVPLSETAYTLVTASGTRSGGRVGMETSFRVGEGAATTTVRMRKTFRIRAAEPNRLQVDYLFRNASGTDAAIHFGTELNLSLLAGHEESRFYEIPGRTLENPLMAGIGAEKGLREVCLVDRWSGMRIRIDWTPAADFWRYPVETVSVSESGFEKNYQGSALLPNWRFNLRSGASQKISLNLTVEMLPEEG